MAERSRLYILAGGYKFSKYEKEPRTVNKIGDAFLEVKVELTAVGVISLCYLMSRQPKDL